MSNASFINNNNNNSQLLHSLNNNSIYNINNKHKDDLSIIKENSENVGKLHNANNTSDFSSAKHKKYDHSHPDKISFLMPILPEDFENCVVSDEDDHLPQKPSGAAEQQLNRTIVLKPIPRLDLNNYLTKAFNDKPVIEEESGAGSFTVNEGEFEPLAYAPEGKTAFYESKKNLGISANSNLEGNEGHVNRSDFANAEKNNNELLKALTHMEQEMYKSEFNNAMHSKSLISNNGRMNFMLIF